MQMPLMSRREDVETKTCKNLFTVVIPVAHGVLPETICKGSESWGRSCNRTLGELGRLKATMVCCKSFSANQRAQEDSYGQNLQPVIPAKTFREEMRLYFFENLQACRFPVWLFYFFVLFFQL